MKENRSGNTVLHNRVLNGFSLCYGIGTSITCYLTLFHLASFLHSTRNPHHSGQSTASLATRKQETFNLFINALLLLAFVCQHSLMATSKLKSFWKYSRFSHLERATYVLATSISLEVMMILWRGSGLRWVLWEITSERVKWVLSISQWGAWIAILAESFNMDHLELLGLKQIWWSIKGIWDYEKSNPMIEKTLPTQSLYRHLRHPVVTWLMIVLWCVDFMTIDRFIISLVFTLYLFVKSSVTEQDASHVFERIQTNYYSLNYHTHPTNVKLPSIKSLTRTNT